VSRRILTFAQFIVESENPEKKDDTRRNAEVHSILLRNRDRIKDEANIDDYLYNRIVDDLSAKPPLSLKEEDVVTDAILMANQLKPEAIPYMKMDQGDKMADELMGDVNGKTSVAVQNYVNQGSGDSGS
jgi:hypothetical protein